MFHGAGQCVSRSWSSHGAVDCVTGSALHLEQDPLTQSVGPKKKQGRGGTGGVTQLSAGSCAGWYSVCVCVCVCLCVCVFVFVSVCLYGLYVYMQVCVCVSVQALQILAQ